MRQEGPCKLEVSELLCIVGKLIMGCESIPTYRRMTNLCIVSRFDILYCQDEAKCLGA
jgi:hypothetical protein